MARSRGQLLAIIDALDVEHAPKFQRRAIDGIVCTFCNFFAADACHALGVVLPQMLAREQLSWLRTPAAQEEGWCEVGEARAQDLAEQGCPVVVGWTNPDTKRSSHIAMVVPAVGGTGTHIAQAGARNFANGPISKGFGGVRPLRFFANVGNQEQTMTVQNNRITEPTTMANAAEDAKVAPIPASPTGIALIPQVLVKILTVVVGLAAVGMTVFGVMLPAPWAATGLAICTSIVGLGAAFGIASPGARQAGSTVPAAQQVSVAPPK